MPADDDDDGGYTSSSNSTSNEDRNKYGITCAVQYVPEREINVYNVVVEYYLV